MRLYGYGQAGDLTPLFVASPVAGAQVEGAMKLHMRGVEIVAELLDAADHAEQMAPAEFFPQPAASG